MQHCCSTHAWEPTWESLQSRPLPKWFDEAKFGIFIHWGVFSVPSFGSEWFWKNWKPDNEYGAFVNATERPGFTYQEYASRFDAALYDPKQWAKLFGNSGAQYVVLTAKHHEGFCNWDSRDSVPSTWNWNAMDVGPHRDILGDLAAAVKTEVSPFTQKTLRWGVYHSLLEWFNPDFRADIAANFSTSHFRDRKTMPELYDLVKKYEPELIWSDGHWDANDSYWRAPEFLAWYATNSSVAETAVWNDRWGKRGGGAYISGHDHYQPGKLLPYKWENALTIDAHSWGFRRNGTYEEYLSTENFIHELIETVAFGGNMLLNVGPRADGTIDAIFADRLLGIGSWLKVNGEAIYGTIPWAVAQNQTNEVYYTHKPNDGVVYVITTVWPKGNVLHLDAPTATPNTKVKMLGLTVHENGALDGFLSWKYMPVGLGSGGKNGKGLEINVPPLTPDIVPCQHAWVFALTGLADHVGNADQSST